MTTAKPTTDTSGRDRILDAAEQIFASDGFAGASMRRIAQDAAVAQGLLHYHFSHKEGLYSAVIARRSSIINTAREQMLAAADPTAPDGIDQIFRALFAPPLGPLGGGRSYARILAGLCAGDARDAALVTQHYDPMARKFVAALQRACPGASAHSLAWAYNTSIGALIVAVAESGRAGRLAPAPSAQQSQERVERLVRYARGGLLAAIDSPPP